MHQLEYLSIGATNVTDNGLKQLYELSSLKGFVLIWPIVVVGKIMSL
jgi:hypothetical protein